MLAIMKRELGAYFASPIGYVFLSVFYFFSGLYFYFSTLYSNTSSLSGVFISLFTVSLIIIPILTMKLLSEDKKMKTDQLLMTVPINLNIIVLGKFFAALFVYFIGVLITLVYAIVLSVYAPFEWTVFVGNFVGIMVFGAALISIGLFVSSLTESQIISAVGSFAIMMFLMMIDSTMASTSNEFIKKVLNSISFFQKYDDFIKGIFNISHFLFFISVALVFNFLTTRILEKRRWG